MSKTDPRRERVAKRISASQDRLKRGGESTVARPRRDPLPDNYPPEGYRDLAREYPFLAVAAGVGLGVLVAAILPRGFGKKAGNRAIALATVAAELGATYGRQARDKAGELAHDGMELLDEGTAPLRKRARDVANDGFELIEDSTAQLRDRASSAGRSVRSSGSRLAADALRAVARLRK